MIAHIDRRLIVGKVGRGQIDGVIIPLDPKSLRCGLVIVPLSKGVGRFIGSKDNVFTPVLLVQGSCRSGSGVRGGAGVCRKRRSAQGEQHRAGKQRRSQALCRVVQFHKKASFFQAGKAYPPPHHSDFRLP